MIPFNKPFLTGKETQFIEDAVNSGKISGNGKYTQLCHKFFKEKFGFEKSLLTTSCTDALEMAAILIDIEKGDEVIIPSFTFVSTANAFVLRGAKVIFADSMFDNPNIDAQKIENLVTNKTKAIIVVHYAGISCDMEEIMRIAQKYNLFVIEDAAQAIDSFYIGNDGFKKRLGSIGHLAAFSFHETKNIIAGEGGLLVINDYRFAERAEIIWEKGTNRSAFFRGSVDKYGWVDIGSSFLPSDIIAAFLYAQLEQIELIQSIRKENWNLYLNNLKILEEKSLIKLPVIPSYATNNAHMFYIQCKTLKERSELITFLKEKGINAVFHYLSLHKSVYFSDKYEGLELNNSDNFSDCLLRLPMYKTLTPIDVNYICECIKQFYL
jgi:dTDP-4-amino-4,6-dideoxygalactose transaminase